MTDLQEIRDKLRSDADHHPTSGTFGLLIWSMVSVCAAALAFAGVMYLLTPRIYPLKPSAGLPAFSETRSDIETGEAPPLGVSASQAAAIRTDPAALAGKSAAEIGRSADDVCFKRAHARYPHWSKTPRLTTKTLGEFHLLDMDHFNELMYCLITEAPARYCSVSERRMIAGEIVHYFRGIEHLNQGLDKFRAGVRDFAPEFDLPRPIVPTAMSDPKMIGAIETRLRGGYLTLDDRDRINASAPPDIRARLARIEPRKSPCPDPPWWAAFWR
jgi:hypothetical protein